MIPANTRTASVLLAAVLVLGACGDTTSSAPEAPSVDDTADEAPAPAPGPPPAPPAPPPPPPIPEPGAATGAAPGQGTGPASRPAYTPPADWQERALAAAEGARAAVVAVGWRPPTDVIRRLESGWLVAPDLVVTSPDVACEAQKGSGLRIRTLAGQFRDASVLEVLGSCETFAPGVALLRLSSPVDAPTLRLRGTAPLELGEPLLAIGHSNWSAAVGGWLVLAGPVVTADAQWIWADIGATVNYRRTGEFFGGGSGGAPLIDLDGAVVTTLCCERDWGGRLNLRTSPLAEPILRRRLTIDGTYYVGGPSTAALTSALAPFPTGG